MSIFKDKKSVFAIPPPPPIYTICDPTAIDQKLLESLQQFTTYLDGKPGTSPIVSPIFISGSPVTLPLNLGIVPALMQNLYNQAFNPLGSITPNVSVSGAPGTFVLNTSSIVDLNPAAVTSALYMVVAFHLTKQLQLISNGTISTNTSSDPINTTIVEYLATLPEANQPVIYQKLKQILVANGFADPYTLSLPNQVEFNKTFYPNRRFGINDTINDQNPGLTPPSLSIRATLLNYVADLTVGRINADRFLLSPELMAKFNNSTSPSFISDATLRKTKIQEEVMKVFETVFNESKTATDAIIQEYVDCLFKAIIGDVKIPTRKIYATGDGTTTVGILGFKNYGISLINYDFEISPSNNNLITKFKKTIRTEVLEKDKEIKIRLDVFGIDSSNEYVCFIINGYRCFLKINIATGINPNSPLPTDVTDFIDGLPIASKKAIFGTSRSEFHDGATIPKKIAEFDHVKQELTFVPELTQSVEIIVSSRKSKEEVVYLISINDNPPSFLFEVEKLFEDDRFEMRSDVIEFIFLLNVTNREEQLANLVELFQDPSSQPAVGVLLKGYGVGKLNPGRTEKVNSDSDYKIFRDSPGTEIEKQVIPPDVTRNTLLYEKLRYSYGRVNYNETSLNIEIHSYVSPLRSRLDKRLLGPNLDGTGSPEFDPIFDYRAYTSADPTAFSNLNRFNNILQPHTWYGANSSSKAFLYNIEPSTGPKLASYNQLLSALRCFGILEALLYRVQQKAFEIDPTLDLTIPISNILNATICQTIKTDGDPAAPTYKEITYADYKALKWYTSLTDRSLFINGF